MLNQNGKYKIYPRGFLGSLQSPVLEKTNNPTNTTGRLHYDMNLFDSTKSTKIVANMTIDTLHRELIRTGIANFSFREKVLMEAFKAFGSKHFHEWYFVQYQSPSFGQTNRNFLDDTIRFIETGTRCYPINTWERLVQSDESNTNSKELGPYAKNLFKCEDVDKQPYRLIGFPEVIQSWISKEGGFNDLLYTLFILFGVSN
jgi:hypothetical protein